MIAGQAKHGLRRITSFLSPGCSKSIRMLSSERPWEDPWKEALPKQGLSFAYILNLIIVFFCRNLYRF